MSKSDIRKVGFPLACHFIYCGFSPYRVEVFSSDSPFLFFNVKQDDFDLMLSEAVGKTPCTVELKGMQDAISKTLEYVSKARYSGVWMEVKQ